MKRIALTLSATLLIISTQVQVFAQNNSQQSEKKPITRSIGQVKNPDFELQRDTSAILPQSWEVKSHEGYIISLDNQVKFSGQASLQIKSSPNGNHNSYSSFSQSIDLDIQKVKRISIVAYLKTDNIKGNTGIWFQIVNKENKEIDFQNSQTQGTSISDTGTWKKYTLKLIVNRDAKKIKLGGYLQGTGVVWFDNFYIDTPQFDLIKVRSKKVKGYLEEFINIVKKNSIYADSLNWRNIESDVNELSMGLNTTDEAQEIAGYVISRLKAVGDLHSFIQSKTIAAENSSDNTDTDGPQPYARLMGNYIGYLSIPGFGSLNDTVAEKFAEKIQNLISGLDNGNDIKGWIVDLRADGGGNMWPMIAGLGPLIGDGGIGYFIHPNSNHINTGWFYKGGQSGDNNQAFVSVNHPYIIKKQSSKIAVLIGQGTLSSGELTAITFIGKSNVKLIGQPSGGYITSTQSFKLSNGAYLYLANSYTADRNKKIYNSKIQPDILTSKATNGEDEDINEAKLWINN